MEPHSESGGTGPVIADLMPNRLLRMEEVKRRVGLSKTTIYALIAEGRFPKPRKIKPGMARWSEREIDMWIADIVSGGLPA